MMKLKYSLLIMGLAASLAVQAAPKVSKNQAIYNQAIAAVNQKNYTQAFQLLKPLADKGDATAQNNIAVLYEEGLGVAQSDEQALKWYEKAAKKGLADAQFMTAFYYAEGRGTAQNYQQAFVWYQKAAKQGHADAQNNLAMRYASGTGVKRDLKKAQYWFGQAAKQGNSTAIRSLQELRALQQSGQIK